MVTSFTLEIDLNPKLRELVVSSGFSKGDIINLALDNLLKKPNRIDLLEKRYNNQAKDELAKAHIELEKLLNKINKLKKTSG